MFTDENGVLVMNRLFLLALVGFILAIGFALQNGEISNSTEIEKGATDLKSAGAER